MPAATAICVLLITAGIESFELEQRSIKMLWTIAVILLVLWALGIVTAYTMSGFIHILLVAAIVIVLVRVIQGRSAV